MKIAFICRYFPNDMVGGGEKYIHEIWKQAKKDFDISLISGWKNDPKLLPPGTYKIKMGKNKFLNYLKFYFQTKKYLKQIKPDLIFSTCVEFPVKGKSIFTLCHFGHWLHLKKLTLKEKIMRKIYTNQIKKFSKVVAISEATKQDMKTMNIKVHDLVYPGIDNDFKPIKNKNKKFTICYPARISPEKGQHIAINAIKQLKNVELHIVGFVNDKNYFKKLIKLKKGLPVKIYPNVDSIKPFYQKSDLILFPTLMFEGFGITAGEALACEKPLITSDFPAIREVADKHAIYVKPGDAKELAKAIENLIKNPKKRTELGKKGRIHIKKNFTWKKTYQQFKKIFKNEL
jgi:glycosyltransferase involved in cell wall biosynthesis